MSTLTKVPVVYLAGGMRSNWQQIVKNTMVELQIPAIFIDPREHACREEVKYTSWDLQGVRLADIVFAYLEKDNPSGAGLALEIGFAAALNEAPGAIKKKIVYIEQDGFPFSRYFGMVRVCSDIQETTLESGIEQLRKLLVNFD